MAIVEGCKGGPALRVFDEINFQEASELRVSDSLLGRCSE